MKVITYPKGCDKVHEKAGHRQKAGIPAERRKTGKGNRRQNLSASKRRSAKVGIWEGLMGSIHKELKARQRAELARPRGQPHHLFVVFNFQADPCCRTRVCTILASMKTSLPDAMKS